MRHRSKRASHSLISSAAVAALLSVSPVAQAVTSNWTGTAGGVWSDGTKWDNGIPNAIGDGAVIPDVVSAARSILLDDGAGSPFSITLGSLQMTNTSLTNGNTVGVGAVIGATLTFDNTGAGPATITANGSGNTATARTNVGADMIFTDTVVATVNNSNGGTAGGFLLGGKVSGPGGFTKTGSGRMTLANTPTFVGNFKDYTGPTEYNDGRTRISLDGRPRFTSAAAIIGNGQIEPISTGNFTFGFMNATIPTLTLQGNGPVAGPDANSFGTIRPSANLDVEFDNPINLPTSGQVAVVHSRRTTGVVGSLKFDGQISGPGGIQFSQALGDANFGTYFITNPANDYTGSTIVYGGTVDSTAGKLGTGPLTAPLRLSCSTTRPPTPSVLSAAPTARAASVPPSTTAGSSSPSTRPPTAPMTA
jgi:autotransporter-associated beta strand protein